ncbi:uncharacterized protein LOC102367123 [Latimeria chalumnae]|uniref:uncharacterized protein LOC102367123 n=1 Tax=Latimeria chalumnae TaxID=7897 RepID=UPI00313ED3B7
MEPFFCLLLSAAAIAAAAAAAAATCLCFLLRVSGWRRNFSYREPASWKPTDTCRYHLTEPISLRLSGSSLKISAHLMNTVFGQFVLVPLMMRITKLDMLRILVIPEEPTFLPLVPPEGSSPDTVKVSEGASIASDLLLQSRAPSSPPGFSFKGISDYLHSFRSGNLTPTQVAENVIQALENSDQSGTPLRAIVQWEREQILKMAAASTVRYRDGKPLSVLDGIPVCLKESIRVVPYFCRGGTAYLGTRPEEEDAAVTKKLREAGAVIIGLANMHELGIGTLGCNPNKFHGTARNPYSPQHYPGGSSSGSAVAVAAGLCPLAIGTDGGGSIRIPSSFCGVVGLKGTFGRISDHGTLPVSYSTVSIGPMCSSVLDTAVAFAMLAGPDPKYPYGLQQPPLCFDGIFASDLKGVKLGIDWDFFKDCEEEIAETCRKAVRYLEGLGATVVDIHIPELEEARVAHVICILGEMRAFLQSDFNNFYSEMNLDTLGNLALGSKLTAVDFIQANRQRSRSMKFLKEIFSHVTCIVTPATACLPPAIQAPDLVSGVSDLCSLARTMRYAQLGNLTGIPGLVVPVGYSATKLPISIQIMGKWWDEVTLLRVGMKLEQFRAETRKPSVYYDVLS